jgi:S-(hydroxymethyl)glutathione dehydrogenase/alcohol dehydrogenase
LAGAHPIIAVDRYAAKLNLARELGASHMIDSITTDARQEIMNIIGTAGLDVFIDNTGQPSVIETGYSLVTGRGRVILVGVPKAGNTININSLQLHFGKVLTGSHGGEAIPQNDIPRLMRLYRLGRLELGGLLTDEYSLDEINSAIEQMRAGAIAGRCIIRLS